MIIKPVVTQVGEKLRIVSVNTKEFKTSQITVSMMMPLTLNLAENMVLATGLVHSSKKYETLSKLNSKLENLYGATLSGNAAKRGEGCMVQFSITSVDNKFALDGENISEECLEFLLEVLMNPNAENGAFNEKQLELEKRLAIEDIESELNDKRAYALTRMIEIMCADEAYGISKKEIMNNIKAITPESLYKAWQDLLSKSTIQISLVGNIDISQAENTVRNAFSSINREPAEISTVFVEQAMDVTEKTEDMEVNQSKLVMGFRSGMTDRNDNQYNERIMVDVFGGGPYSRLFMNVREKLSLCYYCSARLLRDKGIIIIQSGIEKENRQKVLDEINVQLDIMKKGEFSNDDFKASKRAICDMMRGVCDTPDGIDAFVNTMIDEDIITPEEMIENYEKVTFEDVVACAEKMSLDTVYMLSGKESE